MAEQTDDPTLVNSYIQELLAANAQANQQAVLAKAHLGVELRKTDTLRKQVAELQAELETYKPKAAAEATETAAEPQLLTEAKA